MGQEMLSNVAIDKTRKFRISVLYTYFFYGSTMNSEFFRMFFDSSFIIWNQVEI